MRKVIITVAPTGAWPTKGQSKYTIDSTEIAEDVYES